VFVHQALKYSATVLPNGSVKSGENVKGFGDKKRSLELLQPLRWCCVDCVIHHERDVREE